MDTLTRLERSKRMALIRSKDTKPELLVRRIARSCGSNFGATFPNFPENLTLSSIAAALRRLGATERSRMLDALVIGQVYSNEEIFRSLGVSNAGGIRLALKDDVVMRAVVMTSVQPFHSATENPYHDRLEGAILTYTAAGKQGQQTLAGMNGRLVEQATFPFPIHGFILTASRRDKTVGPRRWEYLGLLEYLRHYPDSQLDANGSVRKVWLFEFNVHTEHKTIPLAYDARLSSETLGVSRSHLADDSADHEIVAQVESERSENANRIERVRRWLLSLEPRKFEFFIKDLLLHCGFRDVCVTRFSADGGVDVSAKAGTRIWIFENTVVQIQAKRWLHSVGRKEVAELRGSLQPFARGAVITTGHFSRAAINEAAELGKNPIGLVDGFRLSEVILAEEFELLE